MNASTIPDTLLQRLRCPLTKSVLRLASDEEISRTNQHIAAGTSRDHADGIVSEAIEGGLVSEQAKRLYPIRVEIPSLVVEEAIVIEFATVASGKPDQGS